MPHSLSGFPRRCNAESTTEPTSDSEQQNEGSILKVVCFGEALVDMLPKRMSRSGFTSYPEQFTKFAGVALASASVAAVKLGGIRTWPVCWAKIRLGTCSRNRFTRKGAKRISSGSQARARSHWRLPLVSKRESATRRMACQGSGLIGLSSITRAWPYCAEVSAQTIGKILTANVNYCALEDEHG